MGKRALIILAPGFEEIEALTPIDILRRAGIDVTVAGLADTVVEGSHRIRVVTDSTLDHCSDSNYDALILPGGPGTQLLFESEAVLTLVKKHFRDNKLCCAICAAPRVLNKAGLLKEAHFTCYPSIAEDIKNGIYSEEAVVYNENIITSRGVGTALDFALAIVKKLTTEETAQKVAQSVIFQGSM